MLKFYERKTLLRLKKKTSRTCSAKLVDSFECTSKYVCTLQQEVQFIIYGAHANESEITFLLDLLIEFDLTLNLK